MKKPLLLIALAVSALGILATCFNFRPSIWGTFKNPETEPMLKRFIAMKKNQADAATNNVPPEIRTLFKYAERGNWLAMSNSVQNIYREYGSGWGPERQPGFWGTLEAFVSAVAEKTGLRSRPRHRPFEGTPGTAVLEVYGALNWFASGDEKYLTEFGRQIIDSIPPGSVYFSDAGQYIVTVMSPAQITGDPFFTIRPDSLEYDTYRGYLRDMYGKTIYIPTDADYQRCFEDFRKEFEQQLGSGHATYPPARINGHLAKIIFDQNLDREFFIDGGYPMDWMFPQLEPHGLICKFNRQPTNLSDEIIQRDREYWAKSIQPKIGNWFKRSTTLTEIAAFAEKIHGRHELTGFTGDPRFIQNAYAERIFSTSRSAIAGLYAWRAEHAVNPADKERLLQEADYAFRQAWALGPDLPEIMYRYVNFLTTQSRWSDAIFIDETVIALSKAKGADMATEEQMVRTLKEMQAKQASVPVQKP